METQYTNRSAAAPDAKKRDFLLTSMHLSSEHGYDKLTIWNAGACAGTLILRQGDGQAIAERLLGADTGDWIEENPRGGEK
jgi:hypothetical protein